MAFRSFFTMPSFSNVSDRPRAVLRARRPIGPKADITYEFLSADHLICAQQDRLEDDERPINCAMLRCHIAESPNHGRGLRFPAPLFANHRYDSVHRLPGASIDARI